MKTYFKALEDDMVKALLIASGIGAVIAENASIAGASGGCSGMRLEVQVQWRRQG